VLAILDALTLPGIEGRANEDRFGFTADSAFVIDGATGLGEPVLTGPGGSDAAWVAQFAALGLEALLGKGRSVPDTVRLVNTEIARLVAACSPGTQEWAAPVAAFEAITWRDGRLECWGLGDCSVYIVDARGNAFSATGLDGARDNEHEAARAASERAGRLGGRHLYEVPEVKQKLREDRARFNKPGQAVWTLGIAPDAADHINNHCFDIALPAMGVLATDGFAALVTTYRKFNPAGLVAAARGDGLAMLGAVLRQTERIADPECALWPRYKVSDDATAVLFSIR
jgi:hypothetical protein